MSRVAILPGHEYDLPNTQEVEGHFRNVNHRLDQILETAIRGVKPIRFSSAPLIGQANGFVLPTVQTPKSGYVWAVTRVEFITTDSQATPTAYLLRTPSPQDVPVEASGGNISNETMRYVVDQFSTQGNAALHYSRGQLLLNAGEYLAALGFATVALSAMLTGEAIEVPAEMIGKLLI